MLDHINHVKDGKYSTPKYFSTIKISDWNYVWESENRR